MRRAVVRFRSGGDGYAVGVDRVVEVRAAEGLRRLPDPAPGVAGLLPGEGGAVTVLDHLGAGDARSPDAHILVLRAGGPPFGLLVDEVTGVEHVEDALVGPAPQGQRDLLYNGTIRVGTDLILLIDPTVLERRLGESGKDDT